MYAPQRTIIVSDCQRPDCDGEYWLQLEKHDEREVWKRTSLEGKPRVIFYSEKAVCWYISNRLEDQGYVKIKTEAAAPPEGSWTDGPKHATIRFGNSALDVAAVGRGSQDVATGSSSAEMGQRYQTVALERQTHVGPVFALGPGALAWQEQLGQLRAALAEKAESATADRLGELLGSQQSLIAAMQRQLDEQSRRLEKDDERISNHIAQIAVVQKEQEQSGPLSPRAERQQAQMTEVCAQIAVLGQRLETLDASMRDKAQMTEVCAQIAVLGQRLETLDASMRDKADASSVERCLQMGCEAKSEIVSLGRQLDASAVERCLQMGCEAKAEITSLGRQLEQVKNLAHCEQSSPKVEAMSEARVVALERRLEQLMDGSLLEKADVAALVASSFKGALLQSCEDKVERMAFENRVSQKLEQVSAQLPQLQKRDTSRPGTPNSSGRPATPNSIGRPKSARASDKDSLNDARLRALEKRQEMLDAALRDKADATTLERYFETACEAKAGLGALERSSCLRLSTLERQQEQLSAKFGREDFILRGDVVWWLESQAKRFQEEIAAVRAELAAQADQHMSTRRLLQSSPAPEPCPELPPSAALAYCLDDRQVGCKSRQPLLPLQAELALWALPPHPN